MKPFMHIDAKRNGGNNRKRNGKRNGGNNGENNGEKTEKRNVRVRTHIAYIIIYT